MTDATVPAVPIMSKAKARRLIDRIKTKAESLWADIVEAHDGRAWESLGYKSWAECAEIEFGKSRAHSYKLLNQSRLMGELEAVASTPEVSRARDTLSQRDVNAMTPETKSELVDEFAASETPEQAEEAVQKAKDRPKASKRDRPTSNYESHELKNTLADPEWSGLLALARKHSVDRDALSSRLHRAAVNLAMLADAAGVADPVAFLETDLAAFVESGEVPPSPAYVVALTEANGQQRTRLRAPALEAAMTKQAGSVATKTKADHVHKAESRGASGVAKCKCGASKVGDKWVEP